MDYPPRFPEALQKAVEAARDGAEVVLREATSAENAHRLNCAYDFIVRVFREFADQANEATRQGVWTAVERRKNVDAFLATELIRVRPVTVLRRERETAVIGAGLEPGERVCVSPMPGAVDGMLVRVVEESEALAKAQP